MDVTENLYLLIIPLTYDTITVFQSHFHIIKKNICILYDDFTSILKIDAYIIGYTINK